MVFSAEPTRWVPSEAILELCDDYERGLPESHPLREYRRLLRTLPRAARQTWPTLEETPAVARAEAVFVRLLIHTIATVLKEAAPSPKLASK